MAVQIVAYGLAWNIVQREGRARLRGSDGKTWESPPLDAAQLTAYEAVLRSGASADHGWLLSESGHERAQVGELRTLGGESPFPW